MQKTLRESIPVVTVAQNVNHNINAFDFPGTFRRLRNPSYSCPISKCIPDEQAQRGFALSNVTSIKTMSLTRSLPVHYHSPWRCTTSPSCPITSGSRSKSSDNRYSWDWRGCMYGDWEFEWKYKRAVDLELLFRNLFCMRSKKYAEDWEYCPRTLPEVRLSRCGLNPTVSPWRVRSSKQVGGSNNASTLPETSYERESWLWRIDGKETAVFQSWKWRTYLHNACRRIWRSREFHAVDIVHSFENRSRWWFLGKAAAVLRDETPIDCVFCTVRSSLEGAFLHDSSIRMVVSNCSSQYPRLNNHSRPERL